MKDFEQANNYFEEIKDDSNYDELRLVGNLSKQKQIELYSYLEQNGALYAGGEIADADITKVRNVLIRLWLKAEANNKKYAQKKGKSNNTYEYNKFS